MYPRPGGAQNTTGDTCKKCDSHILTIMEHTKKYDYDLVSQFLCTFDPSCIDNVEFSEVSNAVLFQVFLADPGLCLKSLTDHSTYSTSYILEQLSEPINDGIDLQKLYSSVSNVKGSERIKQRVLEALKQAIAKG